MRIGINTLFLVPGDVGGTEIYLRMNLFEMTAMAPESAFVLFVTRDNRDIFSSLLKDRENVEFVCLPFKAANRPVRILAEQLLLPWYVSRHRLDVLWSPGYTAPLYCRCSQAVTIHDLQYKSHPDDLTFLERSTLDFLVSSACRVCDRVIAVSEFSRQEILKYGFATSEKVFAVLEGVDPVFADSVDGSSLDTVLPDQEAPFLLCVAHTYPHKNVHVLIDAFAEISGEISHDLVLVGKARRGEERVQESLDRVRCPHRVHRVHSLAYRDLISLYQQAAVFVLPSDYEGFGLPVLEAMLAGTPVITTSKASIPEVVGQHGIFAESNSPQSFAQAIRTVLNWDEKERAVRVRRACRWASQFTWEKSAAHTLEILQRTAGYL